MKVTIFKGQNDEWYWRTNSTNGNVTAIGGEGYKNRLDCLERAVKSNPGNYVVHELKRVDGIDILEVVVEVITPPMTLRWRQKGNWRIAENVLDYDDSVEPNSPGASFT